MGSGMLGCVVNRYLQELSLLFKFLKVDYVKIISLFFNLLFIESYDLFDDFHSRSSKFEGVVILKLVGVRHLIRNLLEVFPV